jgi:hypothetical protein
VSSLSARRIVGLAAVALAVPTLGACTQESYSASGNGTQYIETDVRIENATIVAGNPESGEAAFLGTVFNTSATDDEVLSITAGDVDSELRPSPVEIPSEQNVVIQTGREVTANFKDFTANAGTYVSVSIKFKNAGEASFQSLVVPPVGFYSEAAPEGTKEIESTPEELVREETDATSLEDHNTAS